MAWKLIVFDWDGTLVDTMHIAYVAMQTIFRHYRLEPPPKDDYLKNITSGSLLTFYHERGIPRHATREELEVIWQKHFNDPQHHNDLLLRDGAREALAACRSAGAKVSIVSGSARNNITSGMKTLGISDLIDYVEADAQGKVHELRRVLAHFSVNPSEAIYVDDTYEGLSAARGLGMTAIGITEGFGQREHLLEASPDHLIASLHELLPLLGTNHTGR